MALRSRIMALASALLAGALLLSAFAVAPLAFRVLADDHARAGLLAGEVFEASYGCAVVVGILMLCLGAPWRPRPTLAALLLVVLAGFELGYLAPLIAAHGEGWPFSFAALHATASVIHLALVLDALTLAWFHSAGAA